MKICVPIRVKTAKEVLKIASNIRKRGISFIEIWMDQMPEQELIKCLKKTRRPYIVKSKSATRIMSILKFRPAYLDLDFFMKKNEIRKIIKIAHGRGSKIILSFHDFQKTPSLGHLLKIVKKSFELNADIVKVATTVDHFEDNVILFELTNRMKSQKKKVIVLGMGEKGKISRIGCALLGGYLTYVAFDKKHRTAPGQMDLKEWFRGSKI